MGNPAKRRATYDDLLRVPEHMIAEILDGELVTQARPGAPHTNAASILGASCTRSGEVGAAAGG